MQRHTWSGVFVATVFAVSGVVMAQSPASQPAAQSPSTSTPSATQAASSQTASANRVTVTGCLREASPAPAATSGSATPAPTDAKGSTAAAKYEVADAMPSSASTPAAGASTAGTSGTAAQTYQLIANDAALAPHVGQKLQFTGTVEAKDASASSESHPRLHVESANVIASDCSK